MSCYHYTTVSHHLVKDYFHLFNQESSLMHDLSEESQSLTKHSWTPTSEEKQHLKNQGQAWKQGVWSKEETEQLKQNILDYCDVS